MLWEQTPILGNMPEFKYVVVPNNDQENTVESLTPWVSDMGPMAMCYDPNEWWVTSKLSPTSGHWKRLAREAKQSKPKGGKSLKKKKNGVVRLLYKS